MLNAFGHPSGVLLCLVTLTVIVRGQTCVFPEFLQRREPWSADHKYGVHQLAVFKMSIFVSLYYERSNKLTLRVPFEGGSFEEHDRTCLQPVRDRYLVRHTADYGKTYGYLCMQFVPRGDYVVQLKVSAIHHKNSPDLCDESQMEFDQYPFVHTAFKLNGTTPCPFTGGYNMNAFYANGSLVCHDLLSMRFESECDRGSGIVFNFRKSECTPRLDSSKVKDNPSPLFHTQCVTHWTYGDFTFIILQLVEDEDKHFCLRTVDPMNNIREAHLWLKVNCDMSPNLGTDSSQNYIQLKLEKRLFSSTCFDELDFCEGTNICEGETRAYCSQKCNQCRTENQIGQCAFQEEFRGRWIDSGKEADISMEVESYSVKAGILGSYECLNLQSEEHRDKKVLLELYSNGCVPRYACVEMTKATSSVMKFRLGDRINWPLLSNKDDKDQICRPENFQTKSGLERPARLLVNKWNIKEVPCGLPERFHNGIAFREYENPCGGCLHYESHTHPNQFFVGPVNCSTDNVARALQYSCLATFSNGLVHSVVARTNKDDKEQYVYWIFDTDGIKVLKASDAFLYEMEPDTSSDLILAQFFIVLNDNSLCKPFIFIPYPPQTTTTPRPPSDEEDMVGPLLTNLPDTTRTDFVYVNSPGGSDTQINTQPIENPLENAATRAGQLTSSVFASFLFLSISLIVSRTWRVAFSLNMT